MTELAQRDHHGGENRIQGVARSSFALLPEDTIRCIFERGYIDAGALDPGYYHGESVPAWKWDTRGEKKRRKFAYLVSHISQRLRQIALASPNMWTYISAAHLRVDELHARLERSQDAGLCIDLAEIPYKADPDAVDRFMDIICDNAYRWRKLRCADDFGKAKRPTVLKHIGRLDNSLFPLLECVDFTHGSHPLENMDGGVRSWKAPNLFTFCGDLLPPEGITTLNYMDLQYTSWGDSGYSFTPSMLRRFHSILPTYSQLITIHIKFSHPFVHPHEPSLFDTILLPNLEHLSIRDNAADLIVWSFFMSIQAPCLTELKIDVDRFSNPISKEDMAQYLTHFPSVRRLEVEYRANDAFAITAATQGLQYLEHLTLHNTKIDSGEATSALASTTSLRSLRFKFCSRLTNTYIEALLDVLRSKDHFETLAITTRISNDEKAPFCRPFLETLQASNPGRLELDLLPEYADTPIRRYTYLWDGLEDDDFYLDDTDEEDEGSIDGSDEGGSEEDDQEDIGGGDDQDENDEEDEEDGEEESE